MRSSCMSVIAAAAMAATTCTKLNPAYRPEAGADAGNEAGTEVLTAKEDVLTPADATTPVETGMPDGAGVDSAAPVADAGCIAHAQCVDGVRRYCQPITHACVQCLGSEDCPAASPTCLDGACVQCEPATVSTCGNCNLGTRECQPGGKWGECRGQPGPEKTYYRDQDMDGYGNHAIHLSSCTPVDGYVLQAQDCCDSDARVHPGAPFSPDGNAGCARAWDFDCDDQVTAEHTERYAIDCPLNGGAGSCSFTQRGWDGPTVPECGGVGLLASTCSGSLCDLCVCKVTLVSAIQRCR